MKEKRKIQIIFDIIFHFSNAYSNPKLKVHVRHCCYIYLVFEGYKKFLNTILELPDVWIVPIKDGIEYMKASVTSVVEFGWSTFILVYS
jgi:hypothetical protein